MPAGVEALVGLFPPCVGEVQGEHRGCEWGVPQGTLDEPGLDARCQQRGGVGMPQGRDGDAHCGEPGSLLGFAEGALATVEMDLAALAVEIGDLQGQGCMEPEAQARAGGAVDLLMQGGRRLEDTSDVFNTADGGETVGGVGAQERPRSPVAVEDVWIDEADAAGAEAQRSRGETSGIFPVEAVGLKRLCGDHVGRFVIALSPQADLTDIGLLRTLPLATEWQGGNHVLPQWGQKISPFVK